MFWQRRPSLRHRSRSTNAFRRSGPQPTVRLGVERLEDRALLSAYSVVNTADAGAGSLRQAILDANAHPGADEIRFAIPGSGVHTIEPVSLLPTITDSVSINGFTQQGSRANTAGPGQANNAVYTVVIDGSSLLGYNFPSALTITAGNSTVRGLAAQDFRGTAIVFTTAGANVVAGNRVTANRGGILVQDGNGNTIGGLNPADQNLGGVIGLYSNNNIVQGNIVTGVYVAGSNNLVGGTTAAARNVISGNLKKGVEIIGANNTVQGNYIGTDVTGTTSVRNGTAGVFISGTNNTVGGTNPSARNIISGNSRGVYIYGGSQNVVQGNWIGINAVGAVLGNGLEGVLITANGANNLIGGTAPGAGNVISGNRTGVTLFSGAAGNVVQGNKIGTLPNGTSAAGNAFNGIYIVSSGNTIGGTAPGAGNIIAFTTGISGTAGNGVFVESNPDANIFPIRNPILGNAIFSNAGLGIDLTSGANQNQTAPVIQSATTAGSTTTIKGTLTSTPNSTFRIEFFSNTVLDPSGFGEGQKFVGTATVTTAANGRATFTVTVPGVAAGLYLTATATSASNNTSEFSNGVRVVASSTAVASQSVTDSPRPMTSEKATNLRSGSPAGPDTRMHDAALLALLDGYERRRAPD